MTTSHTVMSLLAYRNNVHSQNGEDGILAEILHRLNVTDGWACEFGAWDGIHLSNTFALVEKGWKAVFIEGDREKYKDICVTTVEHRGKISLLPRSETTSNIIPVCAYVSEDATSPTSLDNLLAKTAIPEDFDVLSIDIDSCDYQVWQSFTKYRPKVVIIEINSSILPDAWSVHDPSRNITGTSFGPMLALGKKKGYSFACHTGNMIFVRNDLAEKVHLDPSLSKNPASHFYPQWLDGRQREHVLANSLIKSFL